MTDEQLSLITAAVDGELSPAETTSFRHLLDSSPTARALYIRLKDDSVRLRNVAQATPPANLLKKVMGKIAALTPPPSKLPVAIPISPVRLPAARSQPVQLATTPIGRDNRKSTLERRSRKWVPVALAASLLFAVTGSSFWFFSRGNANASGSVARNPKRPPPATQSGAKDPEWAKWLPFEDGPRPVAPTPIPAHSRETIVAENDSVLPERIPIDPPPTPIAPLPRSATNNSIMGAEFVPDIPPLDLLHVRVPFLKPLAEFDHDEVRKQLADELGRDPAFRIDVFTRQLPRGVETFRNAAKASGVTVYVDPTTLERVNKTQVNSVVVYIESLNPGEVAELFSKLNAEDAKISPRLFDIVHAVPVVRADHDALHGILGIEPGLFKRPVPEKSGPDPSKPINAGTVDQIVKSISAGKPIEKNAILMTWLPAAARTAPNTSGELQKFLSKRGDRKPNAVPVIIVIRQI